MTSVGFVISRTLRWMTWNCLCWLQVEKNNKIRTQFCSQSTAASRIWLCCRTCLATEQRVSTSRQGKETLEVSAAAPVGHNCASRLYSHDVWRLEMFCCRQYRKDFDPGWSVLDVVLLSLVTLYETSSFPWGISPRTQKEEEEETKRQMSQETHSLCLSLIK